MKLEGLYGLYHILYIVISLLLTIGGLVFIKLKIKDEKIIRIIIRVSGALLLIVATTNRISCTYYHVHIIKDWPSWVQIFPNSLCSLNSFIIGITCLLYKKKDNKIFHYVFYCAVIGMLVALFYPDFLARQTFALTATWTGLLHHSLSFFLLILLFIEGEFMPSIKKWYFVSIGYMIVIIYGLFLITAFKGIAPNIDAMNIRNPMISSLKVLTSWYVLGILFTIFSILFSSIYELKVNKKSIKQVASEFISTIPFVNRNK